MAAGRPRDSRGMMVIDNVVRGLRADVHLESVCWRAIDSDSNSEDGAVFEEGGEKGGKFCVCCKYSHNGKFV